MSICQYLANQSQTDSSATNEQWYATPVPLEELPAGIIEDEV